MAQAGTNRRFSLGMNLMGVFLVFGATMAALAGITLVWQGTPLDSIWKLNPQAHHQLAPAGNLFGSGMLIVAFTLALASIGWFLKRKWGWRLAVAILSIQVGADILNLFSGRIFQGAVGAVIGGALIFYLLRSSVRVVFEASPRDATR